MFRTSVFFGLRNGFIFHRGKNNLGKIRSMRVDADYTKGDYQDVIQ